MSDALSPDKSTPKADIPSLEADMAFFDARLSFAGNGPHSAYQKAQIKAYLALGEHIGAELNDLRNNDRKR